MAERLIAEGNRQKSWAAGTGFGGVDQQNMADEAWRATSETLKQQRGERKLAAKMQVLRLGLPIGTFAPDILPVLRQSGLRPGTLLPPTKLCLNRSWSLLVTTLRRCCVGPMRLLQESLHFYARQAFLT